MVVEPNDRHQTGHVLRVKAALGLARARLAAFGRLPPGPARPVSAAEGQDQLLLQRLAQRHGPVFRVHLDGKLTVCVVGLDRARRLLADNEARLCPVTPDFSPLFPGGFLRGMAGDHHATYRRALVEAMRATPLADHQEAIAGHVEDAVMALAAADQPVGEPAIRRALKTAATAIMLDLVLGITEERSRAELAALYEDYATDGHFIVADRAVVDAFAAIRDRVAAEPAGPSLRAALQRRGALDQTMVGNLLQIVEAARHDLSSLWCWIIACLTDHPDGQALVRAGPEGAAAALVREVLRLEQSEYLLRQVLAPVEFEGFRVPRGLRIRICIWESHHDSARFADPFRPDFRRFLDHPPDASAYAPFGLDRHRCPGNDWTVTISALFVEALCRRLDWRLAAAAPAVRGRFHFQPGPGFSIRATPR